MAILTFGQAKAQVANTVGSSTDATLLSEAADEIKAVLEELSLHDFNYLNAQTDIALVAGTADYNLPSNYKKVYDVRLLSTGYALPYTEQRLWDRVVPEPSLVGGPPYAYTLFPRTSNTQAQIRLLPAVGTADTLRVKYYRLITFPTADGDSLDVLERYERWVIYQAKANILANHTASDSRISYWQARADRLLKDLYHEDKFVPDEDWGMMPGALIMPTRPRFPGYDYYPFW